MPDTPENFKSINQIYKELEKLHDEAVQSRCATHLTPTARKAWVLMESHIKAAESMAFALGNAQDPTG